ncbi:MAG: Ig-like domain-containing protein [Treponema sp.]|jgi:hypothetical protein|nr:Ig-like domain-containing protein [Treponema sp.]
MPLRLYRGIFLLGILFFSRCAFVNLEPIGFSTYPAGKNMILPETTSALRIHFSTAMDRLETQKVLSATFTGGNVQGDLIWRGNELAFSPLEPWLPGVRYTLSIAGTLYALDGREERVFRDIPFYVLSREAAPFVLGFSPPNGASVGVNSGEGAFLRIVFSQPMDRQSTADAIAIEGSGEREIRWFDEDRTVEIHPQKNLNPWVVYRWNLGGKARGKNGVPLGKEVEGRFVTDADRMLPGVKGVYPLIRGDPSSGLRWIKTGLPMETGLGSGQAVGIEFTKAMDESALRNIRFDPPLPGSAEMLSPDCIVFVPNRDPEPEKTYTLYVSPDSRDMGGLKMEREFFLSFIPDIPYLRILSLDTGRPAPVQGNIYPAQIHGAEGILTLTLRFSLVMDTPSQAAAALALRLEPFFPKNLKPAGLRSVRWWSADTVDLQWEGIERSIPGETHYYRLTIPGGRGGISGGGSFLKEDLFFIIEVLP